MIKTQTETGKVNNRVLVTQCNRIKLCRKEGTWSVWKSGERIQGRRGEVGLGFLPRAVLLGSACDDPPTCISGWCNLLCVHGSQRRNYFYSLGLWRLITVTLWATADTSRRHFPFTSRKAPGWQVAVIPPLLIRKRELGGVGGPTTDPWGRAGTQHPATSRLLLLAAHVVGRDNHVP